MSTDYITRGFTLTEDENDYEFTIDKYFKYELLKKKKKLTKIRDNYKAEYTSLVNEFRVALNRGDKICIIKYKCHDKMDHKDLGVRIYPDITEKEKEMIIRVCKEFLQMLNENGYKATCDYNYRLNKEEYDLDEYYSSNKYYNKYCHKITIILKLDDTAT